jgi:hypothetical protein
MSSEAVGVPGSGNVISRCVLVCLASTLIAGQVHLEEDAVLSNGVFQQHGIDTPQREISPAIGSVCHTPSF